MEMSGQLHAPAALLQGKRFLIKYLNWTCCVTLTEDGKISPILFYLILKGFHLHLHYYILVASHIISAQ